VIDGIIKHIGGGTGNYSQYRNSFNTRKNISSPFEINLSGNYSPDSRSGSITAEIIATGIPPSNLYLRYAAIETDIEYAWSGEDSLFFVERLMFPSATGISISMSQGETIYDTQGFTFDPSWNFVNMYIAVFIQNETTKEIQQAAKWTIPVDVPAISYKGNYIDDSSGDNDGRADPGETVDMIVSLYNNPPPFQPATNVSATISTDDPDITINNGTASFPDIPPDNTVTNVLDPYNFSVSSSASVHRAKFIIDISAQPNNYTRTDSFYLMIGRPDIICIDNDGGDAIGNIENYFYIALDNIALLYDMATDSSIEMQYLDQYSVAVWFTGELRTHTVSPASQTLLANYLDGGGNLFITGQDIGYDIGSTAFYTNYLHAVFTSDDANYYYVLGVDGDPIGNGLSFIISGGGGANNQGSPDVVSKTADADTVFEYAGTIGPCAVRYSGTYKTVYFSYGFEAIGNEPDRIEVLTRILQWFGLPPGIEESPVSSTPQKPYIKISPNPFTSVVSVKYSGISERHNVSLKIYDMSGRLVKDFSLPTANSLLPTKVTWDGRDREGKVLPSGIYFCKVKSGKTTLKTEKIIMVK